MTRTAYGSTGIYNANAITIQDGHGSALATDVNGRLITSSSSGGTAAITDGGTSPLASMMVGGEYLSSAPTLSNGQSNTLLLDVNGNEKVTLATLIAGEDLTNNVLRVEQHGTYAHIAAGQATTTVKSGAGFLYGIAFNSAATATNVTTVFDSTTGSGTVIAIPAATTATIPTFLAYNTTFSTGLTILTATANGGDMTVVYR